MIKKRTIAKYFADKMNALSEAAATADNPQYNFHIYTESGYSAGFGAFTNIKGRLRRVQQSNTATVGIKDVNAQYTIEFAVYTPKGANEHILAVSNVIDKLIDNVNGNFVDLDSGQAVFAIDSDITQSEIKIGGGIGEHVIMAVNFVMQWSSNETEDTSTGELSPYQIKIELINRTPYHNRTIDFNEPDTVVYTKRDTIYGWTHDYVSAALRIKLPATFVAEYSYARITEYNGKVSNWFVLGKVFSPPNVYDLTLRRDLLREKWEQLENSVMYIEKATLPNNSPLIINKEQIQFNQIKKAEYILSEDDCEWIYLYVEPNHVFSTKYITSQDYDIDIGNSGLFKKIILNSVIDVNSMNHRHIGVLAKRGSNSENEFLSYDSGTDAYSAVASGISGVCYHNFSNVDGMDEGNKILLKNYLMAYDMSNLYDILDPTEILQWNGRIVRFRDDGGNNHLYRVNVNGFTSIERLIAKNTASQSADFDAIWTAAGGRTINTATTPFVRLYLDVYRYSFTLDEIPVNPEITVSFTSSRIEGMAYGIIAIPWNEYTYGSEKSDSAINRGIISSLLVEDNDGDSLFIYDAQKLPYKPLAGEIILTNTNGFTYKQLTSDTVKRNIENSFSYQVTNPKIENQCDMWRMMSPNGCDTYEFSMVKNNGVTGFQLDMRLKPGKPFIQISPNWGGLYGNDFDDYRGLVLSSDFSLPRATSAWLQYIVNNKNYQLIQNRAIENMETNNAINNEMFKSNADFTKSMGLAGSIIATIGGAVSKNPNAIIGGLIGGVTTELNYENQMKNLGYNQRLQNSAIDYANDMFNYNLQNIKAQPAQVQKVDAFDANYKRFPYLEYYSCTDNEREIFIDKLKFNGMTVMAIVDGNITKWTDYLNDNELRYIKAQLIKFHDNITMDEFNALVDLLNNGVFIKKASMPTTP